jgi:SPP1 gp7 family putative phage head morphogenesis protein
LNIKKNISKLKFWGKEKPTINNTIEYSEAVNNNIKAINKIQTEYKSYEYNLSQYQQYNPSPLVIKKTMNLFDDMYMRDEQIKACYNLKRRFIVSNGFNIIIQDQEDEKQKEIQDFLWYVLNDGYDGLFNRDLFQLVSALQYGFSVTEKVFKIFKTGKYKGMIGVKYLLCRPPHSFLFYLSDKGELEKIEQQVDSGIIDDIDVNNLIIYTFDKQFSNPYGISDFTTAYTPYFSKLLISKYKNIYTERFAITPMFATYPMGANKELKEDLLNMVTNLQGKSVAVFPNDVNVQALSIDKQATAEFFKEATREEDIKISRGMLVPELLGFSEHNTGSQSLGIEQFDIFLNTAIYSEQAIIEDLLNEKLLKPLIKFNYGEQEYYARIEFNKPETKDKEKMYRLWIDAVSEGVVRSTIEDENIIRNDIGFSDREEEEDEAIEPKSEPTKKTKDEEKPKGENEDDDKKEFVDIEDDIKYRRKLTEFEEKNADIDNTVESFEKLELKFANNLSEVVNDIRLYTENKIQKEKIIVNKDFKAINNFTLKSKHSKQLKFVFGKGLEYGFDQGIKDTKINIKKGSKSAPAEFKEEMVEMADTLQYNVGSLKPKEAISYIQNRKFTLAGTEESFILKNVKFILEGGITNGKTESQVITELEDFFQKYNVYQYTSKGELENINDITGRLTSVIRTTTTDAYNRGLFQAYNDPKVKNMIAALQYSAIIDDRTTDFCNSYDGRIYNANDSIWDTINPPNHYSCRSTTIPVFTFDKYEVSNKIAKQPAIGFGGVA